jgi:hypothetical protein
LNFRYRQTLGFVANFREELCDKNKIPKPASRIPSKERSTGIHGTDQMCQQPVSSRSLMTRKGRDHSGPATVPQELA